jgi:hypothetical protein
MDKGYNEQLDDFRQKREKHRVKIPENGELVRKQVEQSEQRQADHADPLLGDSPRKPGGVE